MSAEQPPAGTREKVRERKRQTDRQTDRAVVRCGRAGARGRESEARDPVAVLRWLGGGERGGEPPTSRVLPPR